MLQFLFKIKKSKLKNQKSMLLLLNKCKVSYLIGLVGYRYPNLIKAQPIKLR